MDLGKTKGNDKPGFSKPGPSTQCQVWALLQQPWPCTAGTNTQRICTSNTPQATPHSLTANPKDTALMPGGFMKSSLIYDIPEQLGSKAWGGGRPGKEGQHGEAHTWCDSPATSLQQKQRKQNDSRSIQAPKQEFLPINIQCRGSCPVCFWLQQYSQSF